MAQPIRKVKEDGIEIAEWENVSKIDGKKSMSYTIQKQYFSQKTKKYETSKSYFAKELVTIKSLIGQIMANDANNPD
jgi:hypothetical protein